MKIPPQKTGSRRQNHFFQLHHSSVSSLNFFVWFCVERPMHGWVDGWDFAAIFPLSCSVQKINSYISPTSESTCGPRPRAGSWSLPIAFPGCFEAILSDRMLPQILVIMSAQSEIVKISQNWANRENENYFGPG